MNYYKKREESRKEVARKRVAELFEKAEHWFEKDQEVSREMIRTAYAIKQKFNLSLSKKQKLRFCKECKSYLKLGENATVRTDNGRTIVTCNECGNIRRFSYK